MLKPTEDSIARLTGAATSLRDKGSRNKGRGNKPPKSLEERLSLLEISSTVVHAGMMTSHALKTNEANLILWRSLDSTFVFGVSCVIGMVLQWIGRFVKTGGFLGCSAFVTVTSANVLLSWLAAVALWRVYALGCRVSQLPPSSLFRYSPGAYVTAYLTGLVILWLVTSSSFARPSVDAALEEWAARVVLWFRLLKDTGSNSDGESDELEKNLARWIFAARLLVALLVGSLAFCLAEPFGQTIKLILYKLYTKSTSKSNSDNDNDSSSQHSPERQRRDETMIRIALFGILVLPPAIVCFAFFTNTTSNRFIITLLGWSLLSCALLLLKPLLRAHLEQAVPSVVVILATDGPKPTADSITQPFQGRIDRLVQTSGKLAVVACTIMVLLTTRQLCGNAYISTQLIYPHAYHSSLLLPTTGITPKDSTNDAAVALQAWHSTMQDRAAAAASSSSSWQWWWCTGVSSTDKAQRSVINEDSVTLPTSGLYLLQQHKDPPVSLSGYMKELQRRAVGSSPSSTSTASSSATETKATDNSRRTKNSNHGVNDKTHKDDIGFWMIVLALWRHPFLTSTIVGPIMDLVGCCLAALWALSCLYGVIFHRQEAKELASYTLAVTDSKSA